MNVFHKVLDHGLKRLKPRIGVDGLFRELGDDLPLRSELFSVDQLDRHAEALANWHQLDRDPGPDRLLSRLADNEKVLLNAYQVVTEAVDQGRAITPAGEWLLDNFHLIEEQIRTARQHLPKPYSQSLPRLLNGPSAGYPRVYDLGLELISHVDGRVDVESIRGFVTAYQKKEQLNLGELWAIPIMMRQAQIENLRRVAARIAKATLDQQKSGEWADLFIDCIENSPNKLVLVVADMAREDPPLSSAFVAEMARRLSGRSPTMMVPLTWIEQRLWEQGETIEQLVQMEGQQQAVDQVSIGNSIFSLRELDAIDWRTFVEDLSVVEQTLREDPADIYRKMDFGTRDQYRHVIERIAKHSPLTEGAVAREAINLAAEQKAQGCPDPRRTHIGYFLVDHGLPQLEQIAQMRFLIAARLKRLAPRISLTLYLGAISLIAMIVTIGVLLLVELPSGIGWLVSGLLLMGATHLSVGLVNWLVTLTVTPHRIPRLDFSGGIPPEYFTLVAVPTMLIDSRNIGSLLEGMEVRYLANRDKNLRFCLVTDFRDAPQECLPEDESLLKTAQAGIEGLNGKYCNGEGDLFFLFHRPRRWNAQEQTWMGHERKRGKLGDLNRLLRGDARDQFSLIVGDPALLDRVKFVISLDTDTQLPRDTARQLVGTLAHPLNHARIDEQRKVVTEGYGILQPGVATSLEQGGQSWFARLNCSDPGIDPYTRTISDVYQDVFGEGSYIGKGIYDVDAFSATTENRFRENQILSHDLIEGCYVRSGLVNDIQVFERYPTRYDSDVSRRHRWMRGDWQISGWVLPFVSGADQQVEANPLCFLSRWKILDNLRRSLIPGVLMLLLLSGWLLLSPAWVWTVVVAGIVLIPAMCMALVSSLRRDVDVPWPMHLREVASSLGKSSLQAGMTLVFLPYEAHVSLDAIVRTVVRMRLTHRRLLEWKTSGDAEGEPHHGIVRSYQTMWIAPVLAVAAMVALSTLRPEALWAAVPLLLLWFVAPWIAWRISWPPAVREVDLSKKQLLFLHHAARKTWRFFERFVGPEDHWLPPDNYQEEPVAVVAHRTSPTNIGVYLLSGLAAYDFGYISAGQLLSRTKNTFSTLNQLERYQGHFLNWYSTRTLLPLPPSYVSSVDSGNLAGHLLTLRAGLGEIPNQPIISPRLCESMCLLRQMLEDAAADVPKAKKGVSPIAAVVLQILPEREAVSAPPHTLRGTQGFLRKLQVALTECGIGEANEDEPEITALLRDLENQCNDHLAELQTLAPWLASPPAPAELGLVSTLDRTPTRHSLASVLERMNKVETLADISALADSLPVLDAILHEPFAESVPPANECRAWIVELRAHLKLASQRAQERIEVLQDLMTQCGSFSEMRYDFLYDHARRLLSIGYNVTERRRDASYYDLLASEARLASFVAIAQGQIGQDHWFALGRSLTMSQGEMVLLSWSGSMFEYLMPLLVMPSYKHTLLDQTVDVVINRQIEYGRQRNVPWGISESGYNLIDAHQNYQYRAFGVPGLGFKRGLVEDLVIAPYAAAMALMVAPERACANLQRIAAEGFTGRYGFYEAIDYTRSRVIRGQNHQVIRSYMAHHQGMSFLSMAHLLLDQPMQRRFQSDPRFQATQLLLQERIPRVAPFYPHSAEVAGAREKKEESGSTSRVFKTPNTPVPEVHLLSNGRYHVMVTNSGGGYSIWKGTAITRWREDTTRDSAGAFCYVRDVESGKVWSTTHQPTRKPSAQYEAIFSQARAEYRRQDEDIAIHTEIAVSPEDDIEIRRSKITNYSRVTRTIELTSYAEVVLTTPAADAAHPAFSNLFVQTELLDSRQAILCTRRPRSHQEQPPWMFHLLAVCGATAGSTSYETDRSKFIGRGRTARHPEAMLRPGRLSCTAGPVLDPIVSIRLEITLKPDESVSVDFVTGVAEVRQSAIELIDKYRDRHLADRVFDMAWTHSQVALRQLNASQADAQLFGRLASSVIYAHGTRRANPDLLKKNQRGQSGLWGFGISGDLPIVILRVANSENVEIVRQLVQAHAYWRLKGLGVDLVIWNEGLNGYRQELQDQILGLVSAGTEAETFDHPGGIFVRRMEQMSDEDRILLQTVARAIIVDSEGTLAEQLDRRMPPELKIPDLSSQPRRATMVPDAPPIYRELTFFNGLGGFTSDGREYVIYLEPGMVTPAPWVNVLANSTFGTVISESGGSYSWSENAHEFRLSPWYNDPVSDVSGEAYYLRDEETGEYWSPTPQPARGRNTYVCRHGFGYSVFEYTQSGITSELCVFVATDAPIKIAVLKVRNDSGRSRRLSATAYCEWVLGDSREKGQMHVGTEVDPQCGAVVARNPYSIDFANRIAFLDVNDSARTVTGDRAEFLGRNGDTTDPAAMRRTRLSGKVGAGLDPCAAVQSTFELADGRQREVVFTLGASDNIEAVRELVHRFRAPEAADQALNQVWDTWNRTLGAVHVETPDPTINIMANGWLLYQTLACRYWARSGFYQSGGAFGFRDQLQDVAALVYSEPQLIREHLLRAAGHQFLEGDVQHWWHPPIGRGVRTHFSDDYLWLPLITCRYVAATGDTGILDEQVPFIEGRALEPDEEANYDLPTISAESGTLYEHCVRSITNGLTFGAHGLPLIGCGDWNDGMNLVGQHGKGESVWLAFFLHENLQQFAALARERGDSEFAARCDDEAAKLRENIERDGWDGRWYRRAYFDNGEPLGSATSTECRIDSIAQSWAVLSGAGDADRARQAMDAVDHNLVRRASSLIQLFDPPFDLSHQDPGYIKGYLPGVRENGGQYTHAAIWTVMAFAKLGDHRRAWELMAMINPIQHGSTPSSIATYKVEPYVVAADVYAVEPHTGRGGWTWYTGSASWMYRLMTESLLGLHLEVDQLRFTPCLPAHWKSYKVHYRFRETFYHITITQPNPGNRVNRVTIDGVDQPDLRIQLHDDHGDHHVEVELAED